MAKKINPRRKPCSQADIEKAKKQAEKTTLDMAIAIILSALLDGGFLATEQMYDAWQAINYKSDSINKGYCKPTDLIKMLADEYDIIV